MNRHLGIDELAALWVQAGGNPVHARLAAAVAFAESAGDVNAVAIDGRMGLWQISSWLMENLTDPAVNAREAVRLSADGTDWSEFPGYTGGYYRIWLD